MPAEKTPKDPFKKAEVGFSNAMNGWSTLAAQHVSAQGFADVGYVIENFQPLLAHIVRSLFNRLNQVFDQLDPIGAEQGIASFIGAGVEDLLDTVNKLIKDLLNAQGVASDRAIAAVLGLIETVKKTIHLILDGLKNPVLTQNVEIYLDLIDNILGNIAELISPAAGKTAHRFRSNMYGQLYSIRRADAARSGRFVPIDELRDDE